MVRTLLRWAPVVLLAAALAGGTIYLTTREESSSQASARVGTTDDVRWPRDDVVRDLLTGHLEDPAVVDEVRSTLDDPATLEEISVDIPPNQAYVVLVAVAADDRSALQAADTAAEVLVRLENQRFVDDILDEQAMIQTPLAELEAKVVELGDEIERLAAIEGSAYARYIDGNAGVDRAAWRVAEADLGAAETLRSQSTWRISDLNRDLDRVERNLANPELAVVVSRTAQLDDGTGQAGVLPAVLGALAAAVAAGLAALAVDRVTGRARSSSRVAAVVGRDTYDLSDTQSTADFVLDATVRAPNAPIGVFSPDRAAGAASILAAGLRTPELVSLTGETDSLDDLMDRRGALRERLSEGGVLQIGNAADRPGDLILAASLTSVAYVAVDENTSMRAIWRLIRAIESRGMNVAGFTFGSTARASQAGDAIGIGRPVAEPEDVVI
ncbi:MAG: hypothetical protein ACR2P0_03295 [Acidimicrobiales bacterium]